MSADSKLFWSFICICIFIFTIVLSMATEDRSVCSTGFDRAHTAIDSSTFVRLVPTCKQ